MGPYALLYSVEHPPTFRESCSLGAHLYREAGRASGLREPTVEQQIEALLGHKDIDMTRAYLAGHEPPWEDVDCGLTR